MPRATDCTNMNNWPHMALGTVLVPRCPPGGKHNPDCCMYNPHMLEMESWRYPILLAMMCIERDRGTVWENLTGEDRRSPEIVFRNSPEQDWETVAKHVNAIAHHSSLGIVIDDTSNRLSDLANKILEAEKNKELTIVSQTATCVTGACGYTTLHKVVAGWHPELREPLKTDP